jgi:hypothetical protein
MTLTAIQGSIKKATPKEIARCEKLIRHFRL